MTAGQTVLVLGARGHFGARICRRLLREPGVRLVVAGRDRGDIEAFAASLRREPATAEVVAAVVEQDSEDLAGRLSDIAPDIVLHTAGPYQGRAPHVARACIDIGAHYVDLADGRDFVAGFAALHKPAQAADVLLVSGASTLPGLSSAVLAHCRPHFAQIRSVATCIAPAQRTPRGLGTIAAVLSYCGAPFQVLEDGRWVTRHGWQDLRRRRFASFGPRFAAACDVPDLALLPEAVAGLRTATFHAALEAPWEHLALWLMAAARRGGLVRNWQRHAPAFKRLARLAERFGSETGGMSMDIAGTNADGRECRSRFELTARHNHGPEIPCTPMLVLTRRLLRGTLSLRGAHPCFGLMSLEDFTREVGEFDIRWTLAQHCAS